jgi:hypothetical protein
LAHKKTPTSLDEGVIPNLKSRQGFFPLASLALYVRLPILARTVDYQSSVWQDHRIRNRRMDSYPFWFSRDQPEPCAPPFESYNKVLGKPFYGFNRRMIVARFSACRHTELVAAICFQLSQVGVPHASFPFGSLRAWLPNQDHATLLDVRLQPLLVCSLASLRLRSGLTKARGRDLCLCRKVFPFAG